MKYTALAKEDSREKKPKAARSGKVVGRKTVPPGEVRIIGGLYKRSKLPVADRPGLRPTPGGTVLRPTTFPDLAAFGFFSRESSFANAVYFKVFRLKQGSPFCQVAASV